MIKGCINADCNSNQKGKCYSQKEYQYCPECGMQLQHVCKECRTVLSDDEKKYCIRCAQAKQDKKEKTLDGAKKFGGIVVGLAGVVPAFSEVKKIIKK